MKVNIDISQSIREYGQLFENTAFLRLFLGRVVSTVGDSLYIIASTWLVFELTGSSFFAGLAGFLGHLPQLLQFLVGPLVDKYDSSKLLVATELAQLSVVIIVPIAFLCNLLNVYIVLGIIPLLSLFNQFSNPTQFSLIPRILDDELVSQANSTFEMSYRVFQAAANSVSGVLIPIIGAVGVYVVNAGTFAVSAVIFALISTPRGNDNEDPKITEESTSRLKEYVEKIRDGFKLITSNKTILFLIVATAMGNFIISLTTAVLPAYSEAYGGAQVYGVLYASVGTGLFIGSLIGNELTSFSIKTSVGSGFLLSGVSWVMMNFSSSLVITAMFFILAWILLGAINVVTMSTIQIGTPDDKVGRVVAIDGSLSGIGSASAFLIGGAGGDIFSAAAVITASGAAFSLLGLYLYLSPVLPQSRSVDSLEPGTFKL